MFKRLTVSFCALLVSIGCAVSAFGAAAAADSVSESKAQRDARMAWFREARFGLFIHWGVYSVPAGEWKGNTNYGEWFLEETQMPVSQYEKFARPVQPREVRCQATGWPGQRRRHEVHRHHLQASRRLRHVPLRARPTGASSPRPSSATRSRSWPRPATRPASSFCFYHSIMDWHHPDWGTRRPWNDKATGTPDMDRYTAYMKGQLKELLTRYGPLGILWFDGEWEKPWTHERGVDLYNYVRGLQPDIIINNRVGKSPRRHGGHGQGEERIGDYGTPEQEIPATGFGPGVDWESCMTMNNHWGYNKHDQNWKSSTTLIRNLIDCASKGGNYLLNVGPTSEGVIPEPSVERLREIGRWMKQNGQSIYGATPGPWPKSPAWGRVTAKPGKLYLHVFAWPKNGKLIVSALARPGNRGGLLIGRSRPRRLAVAAAGDRVELTLPARAPDPVASVVVLETR